MGPPSSRQGYCLIIGGSGHRRRQGYCLIIAGSQEDAAQTWRTNGHVSVRVCISVDKHQEITLKICRNIILTLC